MTEEKREDITACCFKLRRGHPSLDLVLSRDLDLRSEEVHHVARTAAYLAEKGCIMGSWPEEKAS